MTRDDLKIMQGWPLERKINVSLTRIQEWYLRFDGKVYVSFSGGKDSTVLLDLVRRAFPDVLAVYINTGMEYPEVLKFIQKQKNIKMLSPTLYDKKKREYRRITFKEILNEYGFCYPYKDMAYAVYYANKGSEWAVNKFKGLDKNGKYSKYNQRFKAYRHLLDSPFKISHKCCEKMKEAPARMFERQTGLKPMIALLAEESERRTMAWIKNGCNAFEAKNPVSKPLSFWTEQDILEYIFRTGIEYAPVYGAIKTDGEKFYTTGVQRTGCVFCPIGAKDNPENTYLILKENYPKLYDFCMRSEEEGGLNMKPFLEYYNITH